MQIDGVIIFDSVSGLPLFSKVDESIDSIMFSGFITAIRTFSTHLSLGGLSSFTTEEKRVFLAAKTRIITAMIISGDLEFKQGYSVAYEISEKFEDTYEVQIHGGTDLYAYREFNSKLNEILSNNPFLIQDAEVAKPVQPKWEEKIIHAYSMNQQEELVPINIDNQVDLSSYPVLVIVNTIIKRIYVIENGDDLSSQLLFSASRAANNINSQLWKNEFQVRDVSDPLDCESLIDQAITLTKECDQPLVTDEPNKILFIGLAESGKTTIIKVVADGYVPNEKAEYSATLDYERKRISLMGEKLNVFDLGGQKAFLDRFTGELAEFIFANAKTLIFIVDIVNVSKLSRAKYYFDLAVKKLNLYSPTAPIYVLLHKIDLVKKDKMEEFSNNMKSFLKADIQRPIIFFETSVFTGSIFNAFGSIFGSITKAQKSLERILDDFVQSNLGKVDMVQLFTENGIPLVDTPSFKNVPFRQTKEIFDTTLLCIANRREYTTSTFIETKENIYVVRFLKNGSVLFLRFSQKGILLDNESVPSIYNKVLTLVDKLNSLDS
ncbi:MAG: ADP-ribosylation factor-like protein [Candidatus Hodarchaeales archaeon]